ncbi:hypothetical protein OPS25_07370 [Alteromonas ponticola]|uniref:Uncharacterized protein n=1 Tax=Alteromonas aquimaris TaxID=2998417 RepID=A0ABT3P6B4_9ALTE|nr:hypothetical protein [Alteromonas aquimaris]MCW8108311.1 hypothetical protein [Alteromonas aquimaris]
MKETRPKSRIFRRKNVILEIGSNYYDENDVKRCVGYITSLVAELDRWVLISIPDKSKGVTPDAAHAAAELLQQALQHNCQALLVLTSNTSAKIFAHALKEHGLHHKLICSESIMELLEKAESILEDATLFMDEASSRQ